MIYDAIEKELERMCMEVGVKLCHHCGLPLEGQSQKYHPACGNIVKKINERERKRKNPEKQKAANERYKAGKAMCTCCGSRPVAVGNRFLCGLCWTWDGDGWREEYYERVKEARV
jgi:hypothetical protein